MFSLELFFRFASFQRVCPFRYSEHSTLLRTRQLYLKDRPLPYAMKSVNTAGGQRETTDGQRRG